MSAQFALDNHNVGLTALKKAEDSNALILRFYEWAGEEGNVRIQIPKTVPTHPFEIVTVHIEYPAPTPWCFAQLRIGAEKIHVASSQLARRWFQNERSIGSNNRDPDPLVGESFANVSTVNFSRSA